MLSVGYQIIFQTDDLRVARHISKVMREKYGRNLLLSQAEVVAGSAAVSLILAKGPQGAKLHQVFELAALEAKRLGTGLAKTRFTTPVPMDMLLDSLHYFLKLEELKPDQVVYGDKKV